MNLYLFYGYSNINHIIQAKTKIEAVQKFVDILDAWDNYCEIVDKYEIKNISKLEENEYIVIDGNDVKIEEE